MTSNYSGAMSYSLDGTEYEITRARIDPTKVAIDWLEQGYHGGIVTTSDDGVNYKGRYSYTDSPEQGDVELQLYRAENGDLVLLGYWSESVTSSGDWMFRLIVVPK